MPFSALLYIEVGCLQKAQQDVFYVLSHIARLGESGGIGDREGHVEDFGEGLCQQGFAAAGRPQQEDVALLQLNIIALACSPAMRL